MTFSAITQPLEVNAGSGYKDRLMSLFNRAVTHLLEQKIQLQCVFCSKNDGCRLKKYGLSGQ